MSCDFFACARMEGVLSPPRCEVPGESCQLPQRGLCPRRKAGAPCQLQLPPVLLQRPRRAQVTGAVRQGTARNNKSLLSEAI